MNHKARAAGIAACQSVPFITPFENNLLEQMKNAALDNRWEEWCEANINLAPVVEHMVSRFRSMGIAPFVQEEVNKCSDPSPTL